MKSPDIYTLHGLLKMTSETQANINGKWVPARPVGFSSLIHRIKCAWFVFIGRADAVIWPEGQ